MKNDLNQKEAGSTHGQGRLGGFARIVRAILGLLGLSIAASAAAVPASVNEARERLEQRVLAARELIRRAPGPDAGDSDGAAKDVADKYAQYWSNWPNWSNWGKWPNWPNWGNWFNR